LYGIGRDTQARAFLAELFPNNDLAQHPEPGYHCLRGLAFALAPEQNAASLLRVLHDKTWAQAFIEAAWHCVEWPHENGFANSILHCTPEQFAEFYAWIHKTYPPEDEPKYEGAHTVGLLDEIHSWRGNVVWALKKPECRQGVAALEAVQKRLPKLEWVSRLQAEAREAHHTHRLPCVSPEQLRELVRQRTARFVNSGGDLIELVVEAITRYETYLRQGTNGCPAVMNLWDRWRDGSLHARDEETLSDDLKRYLDLTIKEGVVTNREVQIQRKLYPDGEAGSRTDLWVQAIDKDQSKVTLCIEAKCSWNPSAKTALDDQLLAKYMGAGRASHGILLLGWFGNEDPKKRPVWKTLAEARSALEGQAVTPPDIRALVIDCAPL
jgi:hypothetical protein